MFSKFFIFILIQLFPLCVWLILLKRKDIAVDFRLILSYFLIGSWFGMIGELFLFKAIDFIFHKPIWVYKILPIHKGITSSFGVIMWGIASVYVCFHNTYKVFSIKTNNWFFLFLLESMYLLILELIFNFVAFLLFEDYYFYYFVPDLNHWSSFTNIPFWWIGYKALVKLSSLFYKEEKTNFALAVIMIIVIFSYQ